MRNPEIPTAIALRIQVFYDVQVVDDILKPLWSRKPVAQWQHNTPEDLNHRFMFTHTLRTALSRGWSSKYMMHYSDTTMNKRMVFTVHSRIPGTEHSTFSVLFRNTTFTLLTKLQAFSWCYGCCYCQLLNWCAQFSPSSIRTEEMAVSLFFFFFSLFKPLSHSVLKTKREEFPRSDKQK